MQELMVHHTSSKAEAKRVLVFLHPCLSIHVVLCGQYGYDPLVWLVVQWCINLTHAPINELRGISTPRWIIEVHDTSDTNQDKVCQISLTHTGPSLECYVASMDVISLLD